MEHEELHGSKQEIFNIPVSITDKEKEELKLFEQYCRVMQHQVDFNSKDDITDLHLELLKYLEDMDNIVR